MCATVSVNCRTKKVHWKLVQTSRETTWSKQKISLMLSNEEKMQYTSSFAITISSRAFLIDLNKIYVKFLKEKKAF